MTSRISHATAEYDGPLRENSSPEAPQFQQIQLPSTSPPACMQRKRSREDFEAEAEGLEDAPPSKQSRRQPSPSKTRLSKENLQILGTLNGDSMDPLIVDAPALKRTSSRRSIASSETGTNRTQRSTITAACYRHKHLAAVEIHIHAEPPDYIQAAIDRIVDGEVSVERRAEIRVISQELRDGCLRNVRAQAGEDDFLDPLHTALKALCLKNLCLHKQADWREELKPLIPLQSQFNSSFMSSVQQLEVDDESAPPRKRQQQPTGQPYISPESSTVNAHAPTSPNNAQELSMMAPPSLPRDCSSTKTPRPDISVGIQLSAIISTLSAKLNKAKARQFLAWLQNEMTQHEPSGPLEPMLIPVPAPRALDLAFPFAVVEGKAYSTGKQIFEAENQAAVSGACGLKIQLDLDNLVDGGATSSDALTKPPESEFPLFFSVCTQGPIHELWAHWTIVEDGVRMFESKLLDSCNALLSKHSEEFMVRVNNVGVWGTGPFMKSVVERLGKVAKKAKT